MAHTNKFIAQFALTISILGGGSLRAGTVTTFGWHSGVASLAATSITPASPPANDNVVGLSPNEIFVTQKNYVGIGPVDITFDVINDGGTTEYAVKEGVANSTGLPWVGYHIELGYGFDAGFVKSLPGDGLDFDAPNYDSGLQFAPSPGFYFPIALATEDDIVASGGVMPNGGFAGYFRFSVDVPDGITQFTVRQSPIAAPEPCSCAFALIGLAGLTLYRRRSR
jgi:MYXO-CTERM domain-containing protein